MAFIFVKSELIIFVSDWILLGSTYLVDLNRTLSGCMASCSANVKGHHMLSPPII